jgi:hypothetical protein
MAQPQKQPVLAVWLLTVLVMMVMLVFALVVTTRHGGVMPSLMRMGALMPVVPAAATSPTASS